MRDETDFTAITLQARKDAGATLSWPRIAGYAGALVVHGVLLLKLLSAGQDLPIKPLESLITERASEPGMALVLLDPITPPATARPERGRPSRELPPMTVIWSRPNPTVPVFSESGAATADASDTVPDQNVLPGLSDLQAQMGTLARDLAGPLRERANGDLPQMPGARVIVPLHAPVKRWKQITPAQVGGVLARIFVATMAANPDDYEKIRDGRDPLQEWTSSHLNSFDEPHCDDPEDPLRDRRCYDDDPNLRR